MCVLLSSQDVSVCDTIGEIRFVYPVNSSELLTQTYTQNECTDPE